jgi:hypothetical protein
MFWTTPYPDLVGRAPGDVTCTERLLQLNAMGRTRQSRRDAAAVELTKPPGPKMA